MTHPQVIATPKRLSPRERKLGALELLSVRSKYRRKPRTLFYIAARQATRRANEAMNLQRLDDAERLLNVAAYFLSRC